jgi:hypothetical protein
MHIQALECSSRPRSITGSATMVPQPAAYTSRTGGATGQQHAPVEHLERLAGLLNFYYRRAA